MGDAEPREWVLRVLTAPEPPSEEECADIVSLGLEGVAPLVEGLDGEGPRAMRAARLLLRLRAPEALGPLLRRLLRTPPGHGLYDLLVQGLEDLGPGVALAALEVLDTAREEEARFGLLRVLAHCGARDERIFTALLAQLAREPIPAAANLADYGDARALEPLRRVLEAQEVGEAEDVFVWQTVVALEEALERLGAEVAGGGRSGGGWGKRRRRARR